VTKKGEGGVHGGLNFGFRISEVGI
jgi:hypothetical protein